MHPLRKGVQALALTGLVLLTTPFWPTLGGEFIWIDTAHFKDLAHAYGEQGPLNMLLRGSPSLEYRPSVFLLHGWMIDLLGGGPQILRGFNLALHVVNSTLFYFVACKWSRSRSIAAASAAIMLVHPTAATAISWASDLPDPLCLAAVLAAVLLAEEFVADGRARMLVCSTAAFTFALGAKEFALMLCVPMAIHLGDQVDRKRWMWAVASWLGAAALWWCWVPMMDAENVAEARTGGQLSGNELFRIAGGYVREWTIPTQMRVCDDIAAYGTSELLLGIVVTLAWLSGFVVALKRRSTSVLIALTWIAAFYAPTSGIIPLRHLRADRFLYAVSPGIAFLLATFWHGSRKAFPRSAVAGLACYLAFLMLVSHQRSTRMLRDETLWTWEIEQSDSCLEGHSYLALNLADAAPDRAMSHARHALIHSSDVAAGYVDSEGLLANIAYLHWKSGRLDRAKAAYRKLTGVESPALRAMPVS